MSIEKKIYWSVGLGSLVLLVSALLFPADRPDPAEFPWHITHPTPNALTIFGLTLGQSTINDAEQRFKEKAEVGLFRGASGNLSAEAFFEQINLAGLRSKVVLTLVVSDELQRSMHDRGLRMTATGGSGKKITLDPADLATLTQVPIGSLTLIPGIRVDEALLLKRFGAPTHVVKEANGEVTHRLYAQHALDISTSTVKSEKQVLQYISPGEFNKLLDPLLKNGGQIIPQ